MVNKVVVAIVGIVIISSIVVVGVTMTDDTASPLPESSTNPVAEDETVDENVTAGLSIDSSETHLTVEYVTNSGAESIELRGDLEGTHEMEPVPGNTLEFDCSNADSDSGTVSVVIVDGDRVNVFESVDYEC